MASALLTKPSNKRVFAEWNFRDSRGEGQGSGLLMEEHLPTIYKDLGSTSRTGGGKGRRRKEGLGRKEKKKDILLQPSTMNTKYKHLIQLTGVSLPLSGYHLVG